MAGWNPQAHPRDSEGKFTERGGGVGPNLRGSQRRTAPRPPMDRTPTWDEEEAFLQGISVAELQRRNRAKADRKAAGSGGLRGARREAGRQIRGTVDRILGRA